MRVCIVSATYVTQEPRVLRQIRTFQERGWQVSVVGFPGRLPVPESWDFHDITMPAVILPETAASEAPAEPVVPAAKNGRSFLAKLAAFIYWRAAQPCARSARTIWTELCRLAHRWRQNGTVADANVQSARRSLAETLYELERPRQLSSAEAHEIFFATTQNAFIRDKVTGAVPQADLVIAHDYMTMPFAGPLAERMQASFVVDIHEYAVEQYHFERNSAEERYFSHVTRPMIEALHRDYFPKARALSAVSEGISRQIQIDYALPVAPTVIRSTPFYNEHPFHPTGEVIEVMYHGLVNGSRHLEVGIRSLPLWRPEFRLTIRGPGPEDYIETLKTLAAELGVEDRLSIEPPVPFDEIVMTANRADIGYLALMNFSRQRQFVSPNKFFEYVMAGLALVVMDFPDLAPTVRATGIGRLIEEFTPEAIATAINSFDRPAIDAAKHASLALARDLCWEREQERMVAAYGLASLEAAAERQNRPSRASGAGLRAAGRALPRRPRGWPKHF